MRFLSADLVFPIHQRPIPNGILAIGPQGTVEDLLQPTDQDIPDESRIEKSDGILCPGFVNAHCHLELSHMKGLVAEKTGLPKFITEIVRKRDLSAEGKLERIQAADDEMWGNGIQAVGDICNTDDTLETKLNSRIAYHSFVEVFSFDPTHAEEVLAEGIRVAEKFQVQQLPVTIVPHAPYSVSKLLFSGISIQQLQFPGPISIHNQETESEDQMFVSGSGELVETFKGFGADFTGFEPKKQSSLDFSLPLLPHKHNVLLVHNTCSNELDLDQALALRNDLFWCSCPNANRYIENRLPDIPMWIRKKARVCVGTDSLASNQQLSILEELKLIQNSYPEIRLPQLLKMACLTGAQALNMESLLGSFEIGKQPGVLLLKGVDTTGQSLKNETTVQRII